MTNPIRSMPVMAMAAILGCATLTVMAPTAAAKQKPKKEEAAQSKAMTPSKGFLPAVKKMQTALKAKDEAALQAALVEGQGTATTPEDKYLLASFGLQSAIQTKDQAGQAASLDAMIDSGLAPQADLEKFNFYSGNFAYVAKDYAKAVQRLEAAKAAGASEPSLPSLLMDSYFKDGQIDKGIAYAKASIAAQRAAGQQPTEDMYVRPALALQSAKRTADMLEFLTMRLQDYGTPKTWGNTLQIYMSQAGADKDLGLDTLRLMRATKSLTRRNEILEYAGLATEAGFPGEAVAVIKEGQSAGVIPAGDARFASILEAQTPRAVSDAASLNADAAKAATLANPKLARVTADALVGIGSYAKAVPLYDAALKASGGTDGLVLYRLGVAQALAGDREAALQSFAKVQGNHAALARLWSIQLNAGAKASSAAATAPETTSESDT